jgi:deoxyribodipyrimidine photo-lyase
VDANHGLLYAVELANAHRLPVLYYEGLTCSYRYANDRLHTFLLEGVPETAKRLKKAGIGYCFYLRKRRSDRNDVFYVLAAKAAAIVTDDYPVFIARDHNKRVPERLDIPYFAVDSSCIVPMRTLPKREFAAYTIRPKIHRALPRYWKPADTIRVKRRYDMSQCPFHSEVRPDRIAELVASCEIDHSVPPALSCEGGRRAAERRFETFLAENLRRYARDRNNPSAHATSELSPYLHFGQISSLEIALRTADYAKAHKLIDVEYLEELIVRRELAFNCALYSDDPVSFANLPDWAQETMRSHARDKRPYLYTRDQLERAETSDELWNASQRELLLRGKIHGYYRMYWGKKMIEWSATYQDALDTMVYLHDRYALDGRDPNTYTNILWCFGLHDRAWGERAVFGKIRYMSFEGMKRKTDWEGYVREIRDLSEHGKLTN